MGICLNPGAGDFFNPLFLNLSNIRLKIGIIFIDRLKNLLI